MHCRLCFKLLKRRAKPLFTSENCEHFVHEMIQKYFELALPQDEAVVQQICNTCRTHLNDFHKYCEYVKHRQITWQQELAKVKLARQTLSSECKESRLCEIDIGSEDPFEIIQEIQNIKDTSLAFQNTVKKSQKRVNRKSKLMRKKCQCTLLRKRQTKQKIKLRKLQKLSHISTAVKNVLDDAMNPQTDTEVTPVINLIHAKIKPTTDLSKTLPSPINCIPPQSNTSETLQIRKTIKTEPIDTLQELPNVCSEPVIHLIPPEYIPIEVISEKSPLTFETIKSESVEVLPKPKESASDYEAPGLKLISRKIITTTDITETLPLIEVIKSEADLPDEFAKSSTFQKKYRIEDLEKIDELIQYTPDENWNSPQQDITNETSSTSLSHFDNLQYQDGFQIFTIRELGSEENFDNPIEKQKQVSSGLNHAHKTVNELAANIIHLKCDICEAPMETVDKLRQHCKVVHKSKGRSKLKEFIQCSLCKEAFANRKFLDIHTQATHATCSFCKEVFISNVARDCHIQEKHNSEMKLTCPHCPKVFYFMPDIYIHISLCHMDQWPKTNQPNQHGKLPVKTNHPNRRKPKASKDNA